MKKSTLCSALALACALGLTACGGDDDGELRLYLALDNVTTTGMLLSNNGGTPVPVPPVATFVFPGLVPRDSNFDFVITALPSNAESCKVINGKGNTGAFEPNNIAITCIVKTFAISGTVTGLNGGNLVINNGRHSITIPSGAATFTLSTPTQADPKLGQVPEGKPYGLTILQQPAGLTCTIARANGTMPAAAVTDVAISCVP